MRLYSFTNYYLSPLQQGLQTAHLVAEMSVDSQHNEWKIYELWAVNHKTIIIKNGGNSGELDDLYVLLVEYGKIFDLPCAKFKEDGSSLNYATTAVGIIIPEEFYEAKFIRGTNSAANYYYNKKLSRKYEFGSLEYLFMELFNGYRLA